MEIDFYATTDTAFATFLILSDFIIVDFCVPLENKPSRKMFFFEYKMVYMIIKESFIIGKTEYLFWNTRPLNDRC